MENNEHYDFIWAHLSHLVANAGEDTARKAEDALDWFKNIEEHLYQAQWQIQSVIQGD